MHVLGGGSEVEDGSIHHQQQSVEILSDSELTGRLVALCRDERELTIAVLVHLGEVDRRELYAREGYRSLYSYCVQKLRCSESAANRRVRASRCLRRFPAIGEMLVSGKLNLCTVAHIAPIITEENGEALLGEISGKSSREVEWIVSRHRPGWRQRDHVRAFYVHRVVPDEAIRTGDGAIVGGEAQAGAGSNPGSSADSIADTLDTAAASGKEITAGVGGKKSTTSEEGRFPGHSSAQEHADGTGKRLILEKRFKLSFTVNPGFMEKVKRARALLSNDHPEGLAFEQFFELVLDEYLERNSPEGRMRRRKKREEKKRERSARAEESEKAEETPETKYRDKRLLENKKRSRRIPRAVRDAVYLRDKGRCTFVGTDGKRCDADRNLQIDHIVPYARGGGNSLDNLRLLCARHNRLEAEREYGEDHMKKFHRRE